MRNDLSTTKPINLSPCPAGAHLHKDTHRVLIYPTKVARSFVRVLYASLVSANRFNFRFARSLAVKSRSPTRLSAPFDPDFGGEIGSLLFVHYRYPSGFFTLLPIVYTRVIHQADVDPEMRAGIIGVRRGYLQRPCQASRDARCDVRGTPFRSVHLPTCLRSFKGQALTLFEVESSLLTRAGCSREGGYLEGLRLDAPFLR